MASRYTLRTLPWPAADEVRQLDHLLALATRYRLDGWAIFPTSDEAVALIARHRETLAQHFKFTTPSWEVVRWAYDKRLTYRLAKECGVDHPWTRYPRNRGEVATLECTFPIILKPAVKESANGLTTAKAWRVEDHRALLTRYDEACTLVAPDVIMVQELIPGGGESQFSYAALCQDGHPLAGLVARRTRQYPMDFGRASTYVETVDQPEVEEQARRLLAAMHYTGLVEVEFKRDQRTDRYKLLDINARAWLWHTLGWRAGVDFPYLLWKLIHGEPVPEVRARTGARWMHMFADFPAAVSEMRCGRLSPGSYLRSLRGPREFAIFAADDPLPALIDGPLVMYRALKQRVAFRRQ